MTGVPCVHGDLKRLGQRSCFAEPAPDRVWPVVLAQLDAIQAAAR